MSGIFDPENKVMQIGVKFADLLIVNAMTMILSIPIVTMGAAFSAMHDQVLKIWRDEQTGIFLGYWKAFLGNLKQGTALWLIYMAAGGVVAADLYLIASDTINWGTYFNLFALAVGIIYLVSFVWIFVLQSRYTFGIKDMIKYSLVLGFRNLPASIAMIVLFIAPFALFLINSNVAPWFFLMGLSLPAFLQAMLYSRVLDRFEGVKPQDRVILPD